MARKQGAVWSYIFMVLEMLSSILFTPFLIRSFGQAEYGIYSLVLSITAYLALLDMGVGNAIVRYMAKFRALNDNNKQRNLLAVTVTFYTAVGILAIIVGVVLNSNMDLIFGKGLDTSQISRARQMFSITMLNVAFTLIFAPFDKTIVAFEKFVFQKVLAIIKIIVRVGISVIVLILGGKGVAIVSVNFSITVIFGIVSVLFVAFKLHVLPKFKGMNISFIKDILGYSVFVFIQMIATQINALVDQILIGALVSSSAVILGVYAVGAQINQYFQSIAGGVNGVLMPGVVNIVEHKASSDRLLSEMIKIGRILFMILGLVWGVFLIMGDEFIVLWAGEANSQAYTVACILITPMMLTLVQSIGSQILWALNKHKVQAFLKIAVAVLNIFLTILLIKWDPLIGASIGTAIAIVIGDIIVMNIVFTKDIGISMKKYYAGLLKDILPNIIVVMIVGIIIKTIIPHSGWMGFILICGVMIVLYAVLMYINGFNQYEKQLFNNTINKFKMRKK